MLVVEFRVVMFPVVPLKVTALDVVAFVVEALSVAKLPVVPNSVPIVAEVKLAIDAKRVERMFRLVIEEVAATRELALKLVDVELVIVPLEEVRFVLEIFVAERLVDVEFVSVS